MDYRKIKDTIYLRVDKGEAVIETILRICEKEGIEAGHFQGIGACDKAVLAVWIPQKEDFVYHTLTGMLEMVSLIGNISTGEKGKPYSHSHGVFSFMDEKGEIKVTAGHLVDTEISYTGEIVLRPADERIGRRFCEESGIEVWDLRDRT